MLKLGRVAKVKVLFLVLVFVFNYSNVFEFSAAILEKGLLHIIMYTIYLLYRHTTNQVTSTFKSSINIFNIVI